MRANFVLLVLGSALLLPTPALAQSENPITYANADYGFQAVFPEQPMAREVPYIREDGTEVTAQQFYVEQGTNQYLVTVVNLPDGPAIDFDAFDHAVEQTRANGDVRAEYEVSYDPGVPGWQLSVFQPDGRQRRASIYIWAHRLIITEAITEPGDFDGLRLEQSVVLLNADGSEVDTGSGNVPVVRPK